MPLHLPVCVTILSPYMNFIFEIHLKSYRNHCLMSCSTSHIVFLTLWFLYKTLIRGIYFHLCLSFLTCLSRIWIRCSLYAKLSLSLTSSTLSIWGSDYWYTCAKMTYDHIMNAINTCWQYKLVHNLTYML